jgi:hypothetical protein
MKGGGEEWRTIDAEICDLHMSPVSVMEVKSGHDGRLTYVSDNRDRKCKGIWCGNTFESSSIDKDEEFGLDY